MTLAEAADLLALAAARDRRTIGETDVRAWAADLQGLNFADCADAVSAHFRDSAGEYLTAAHVRARVKAIRDDRWERHSKEFPELDEFRDGDPRLYNAKLRELQELVRSGRAPVAQLLPRRDVPALMRATLSRLPKIPQEEAAS